MDMALERARFRKRERLRKIESVAARCGRYVNGATGPEAVRIVRERFDLNATEARRALKIRQAMEDRDAHAEKHVEIEELGNEMANDTEMAERIREATREVLTENPGIDRGDAYAKVIGRTGAKNLQSSWEVTYFYPIRKELGQNGKRRPKRSRPKADPDPVPTPDPEEDRPRARSPEEVATDSFVPDRNPAPDYGAVERALLEHEAELRAELEKVGVALRVIREMAAK